MRLYREVSTRVSEFLLAIMAKFNLFQREERERDNRGRRKENKEKKRKNMREKVVETKSKS